MYLIWSDISLYASTKSRCLITVIYQFALVLLPKPKMFAPHTTSDKTKISSCDICGSDLHTIESGRGPLTSSCAVGHEIVGEVALVGSDVKDRIVDDRVDVSALAWSCLNKDHSVPCKECSSGDDAFCTRKVWTYNGTYKNDGATSYGDYADYVHAAHEFAFKIPDNIPDVAAPLVCADATMFTPLKEADVKPDKRLGVVNIGDLGHLDIQFANAMSNDAVIVFSRSANKEQKVDDCGTTEFVVKTNKEQVATVIGLADVLRSSYAKVLALMALLVCVAARVTTSAWIPQDVMRKSLALKAVQTPVEIKRNLRFHAAKSNLTFDFGERSNFTHPQAEKMMETIYKIYNVLSKDPQPRNEDQLYDAAMKMFVGMYSDYEVAKLFASAITQSAFVENGKAAQTKIWKEMGLNAAEVFSLLKLGETNEPLFENPLFYYGFVHFIGLSDTAMSERTVFPILYPVLSSKFTDEALVEILREGAKTHDENFMASVLLLMRLLKGQLAGETEETSLKIVGLNTNYDTTMEPLEFIYTVFSTFYNHQHYNLDKLKYMFGMSRVAEMLANVNKSSPIVNWAQQLRTQLYQRWFDNREELNGLAKKLRHDGVSEADIKVILGQYLEHVRISANT